jgi:hypothetical protein
MTDVGKVKRNRRTGTISCSMGTTIRGAIDSTRTTKMGMSPMSIRKSHKALINQIIVLKEFAQKLWRN